MKKLLLVGVLSLSLGACAGQTTQDRHMLLEKADTEAALAYVGIASVLNQVEVQYPEKRAQAEGIKRQAYAALQQAHAAYAAGEAINLSIMANFASQAAALNAPGGQ